MENQEDQYFVYSNKCFLEKFILQKLAERINEPLIFDKLKVSPECQQASNEFFNALNHHELWALQSKKTILSEVRSIN